MKHNFSFILVAIALSILCSCAKQPGSPESIFINLVREGDVARVKSFLSRNNNIDINGVDNSTPPLIIAIEEKNEDMANFLLKNGAKPGAPTYFKNRTLLQRPIFSAIQQDMVATTGLIIDRLDRHLWLSTLDYCSIPPIYYSRSKHMKELLLKKDAPYDLFSAAILDDPEGIEWLIGRGHDPLKKDSFGDSPLFLAVGYGNFAAVQNLISVEGLELVNKKGKKCMFYASNHRMKSMLRQYPASESPAVPPETGLEKAISLLGDHYFRQSRDILGVNQVKREVKDLALIPLTEIIAFHQHKVLLENFLHTNRFEINREFISIAAGDHELRRAMLQNALAVVFKCYAVIIEKQFSSQGHGRVWLRIANDANRIKFEVINIKKKNDYLQGAQKVFDTVFNHYPWAEDQALVSRLKEEYLSLLSMTTEKYKENIISQFNNRFTNFFVLEWEELNKESSRGSADAVNLKQVGDQLTSLQLLCTAN